MEINWKNLIEEPPAHSCDICLKVGDNYETYKFIKATDGRNWWLAKPPRQYRREFVPTDAKYIILNQ